MTQLDAHYANPRLVDLYDIENPLGVDTDFYLGLAAELDALSIVDLGCGTGLLTRELAAPGREVFGVDPAGAVWFEGHNVFRATGEVVVIRSELRMRSQEELVRSLDAAGFTIKHVYGDWHKGPLGGDSNEMVFVARRS